MALSDALKELEKVSKTSKVAASVKGTTKPKPKVVPPLMSKSTPIKAQEIQTTKPVEKQAVSTLPILDKKKTTAPAYGTKGYMKTAQGTNIKPVVNPYAVGITEVVTGKTAEFLPGFKEAQKQAAEQFPKSYGAGKILGYAGPTGLAAGVTKGLVGATTKNLSSKLAKKVVEGAIIGTTAEATQIVKPLVKKEITPEQAGKQLTTGLAYGAGIDVGLYGLGKIAKPILSKIKSGIALSQAEKVAAAKQMNVPVEDVDTIIQRELGLPKETTAQDFMRQQEQVAKDIELDQYYKSFEKDGELVRPLVSETPIRAEETSLVRPLVKDTAKTTKSVAKPLQEIFYRGEMQESKIGEKANILRPKGITDIIGVDPVVTKAKLEKTIQSANEALNNPMADKDFYRNEIYQAQQQLKKVEDIIMQQNIREEASKIPVSYVTSQKETAKLYANQAKEAAKKLGYNSEIFGDVSELQKPIIKKFKLDENRKTLDLTKYGENGFVNIDEIEQMLKNEFGISGNELDKEVEILYNSRFYNQDTDSMPVYALFKDENLINNYKRLKDNVDVIRYSEGNQDNYAILNRNVMKELKLPTIKKDFENTPKYKSIASEIEKPTGVSEKLTIPVEEQENFRRTIHNSLMKSELPDDLKKAYEETPSVYQKANNEEDWAKAWDKVSKNYEGSKTALRSKDALESADDTMEYIALLQQASKRNIAEAKQLADDFAEKGTKAGQAIQAIIALQKTTPEGQLVRASQTIKGVEDAFKNSNPTGAKEYEQAKKEIEKAIKENKPLTEVEQLASKYKVKFKAKVEKNYENLLTALKEKYKLPSLSDEEAKQIVDLMEQGNKETGRKQELLFAKVDQLISDKVPPTLWDKIKALRNMSLLGNIKTIGIRNPLGNLIFTGLENVQQIPSGITDKMVSAILKTPRYTKVLPDLRTQAKGLKKGVSEAWEDVLNNVDTSPTRGGAELPRNRKVFETAWLNKANNWLGDALKFGDRPFYQAAYDARLKELMDLQPNAKKEDLEKLAKEFGLERTFQNNSTTSQAMGMIKRGLNLNKDFGLGDIAMPYTQTPSNILEKGVQYTPLNLVNIGSKLFGQATGKETIRNNPKAFSDAVGRMFTGSGAIALGYKLASEGMISGTQKEDSPKEKAIKKQVGEQQYSVKIGDKWYSFDWAQPASIPLAIGADMYLAGEDKETALAKIQAGIESGLETVFTQGVTQGIARMFGGSTVTSGITETAAGLPTQFIPTLSGQAAQQSDVYKRDVDYSSIPSQVKTTAMKKIPVIREQLPASLDLFGQPIKEQSGREGIVKALSVFISPTNISTETSDKLSKELYNLYKRTGETDVIPSKLPDGLTTQQKYEFKQKFGNEVRTRLERAMDGAYNTYTDERKIKAVRSAIDSAYEKTKKEMKIGK